MRNTFFIPQEDRIAFGSRQQGFWGSFARECRKIVHEPCSQHALTINEENLIIRREYFRAAEYSTRT